MCTADRHNNNSIITATIMSRQTILQSPAVHNEFSACSFDVPVQALHAAYIRYLSSFYAWVNWTCSEWCSNILARWCLSPIHSTIIGIYVVIFRKIYYDLREEERENEFKIFFEILIENSENIGTCENISGKIYQFLRRIFSTVAKNLLGKLVITRISIKLSVSEEQKWCERIFMEFIAAQQQFLPCFVVVDLTNDDHNLNMAHTTPSTLHCVDCTGLGQNSVEVRAGRECSSCEHSNFLSDSLYRAWKINKYQWSAYKFHNSILLITPLWLIVWAAWVEWRGWARETL